MKRRNGDAVELDRRVLAVCRQAVGEGRWQVAEHLLRALEELSGTEPAARRAVRRAYLLLREGCVDARRHRHR